VQKSTGRKNSQRLFIMAMSAMIVVVWYDRAAAYIDPSIGSYLFQLLLAGLLGAMFALKVFWGNIKRFFTGAKGKDRETDGNDR
jgi:hypothetical protein